MKITIISDKDYQTEAYISINKLLHAFFSERGFDITMVQIGRDDLAFCMGCFGCWVKKPGECVINDSMAQLNRNEMNSDVVIFLSPVIFGQFSANIKNVVDRWLPNMLPFFEIRPDGSTMHPPRYADYPQQVIIGYGNSLNGNPLSEREKQLFIDITEKHRRNVGVLIWEGDSEEMTEVLQKIEFKRVSGGL